MGRAGAAHFGVVEPPTTVKESVDGLITVVCTFRVPDIPFSLLFLYESAQENWGAHMVYLHRLTFVNPLLLLLRLIAPPEKNTLADSSRMTVKNCPGNSKQASINPLIWYRMVKLSPSVSPSLSLLTQKKEQWSKRRKGAESEKGKGGGREERNYLLLILFPTSFCLNITRNRDNEVKIC